MRFLTIGAWRMRLQRTYQRPTYVGTRGRHCVGYSRDWKPATNGRPGVWPKAWRKHWPCIGWECFPWWRIFQTHQLSGVDQCHGGRAVCERRSLKEFPSAATLIDRRVAEDRATAPQGQSLSALASVA
ncbi:MAG: hypothetical protein OEZ41_09420 [Nitrospirota bacterium]|nr:hypothetical protein [Nitrospirota bacterium]